MVGDQSPPKQLTGQQRIDARRQIERMLAADEAEADAIRQRLAGLGAALLPEVYACLKDAAADQDRRRLLILRYRLAAPDSLVLRWPGGLERLGDTDPRQRRRAADELAKLAGDGESRCCWSCLPTRIPWSARSASAACNTSAARRPTPRWSSCWPTPSRTSAPPC